MNTEWVKRGINGRRSRLVGDTPSDGWDTPDEAQSEAAQQQTAKRRREAWDVFAGFYLAFFNDVLNIVSGLLWRYSLRDRDMAEQLTQEAFMKAWDALPQKNPQISFLDWIKVIALNGARSYVRKRKREISFNQAMQLPANTPTPLEPSPEEQAERNSSTEALRVKIERVMQRLTKKQRRMLELHHGQEKSVKEIAEMLGIKSASVRQMIWRASARFRELWKEEEGT
jgi:RNA polymerase sigma-70 factor (ECF subfamily)